MFLRLLGAIYLVAFVSLWTQLIGLVGHNGILPADHFLQVVREQLGPQRYWLLPTVCWLNASDAWLHGLCALGSILSVFLICDIAPALVLFLLWGVYLSLVTVCRDFLSFQWDNLLLETGFLAILLSPLRLRPGSAKDSPPSTTTVGQRDMRGFSPLVAAGAGGTPRIKNLSQNAPLLSVRDGRQRSAVTKTTHYDAPAGPLRQPKDPEKVWSLFAIR